MAAIDDLSPDDVREAINLANQLHSAVDTASQSTEENLAQAVARVRDDRERRKRQAFRKRALQLAAVIVVFAAADAFLSARHAELPVEATNVSTSSTPSTAPLSITLPAPESSVIAGIPMNGLPPLRLKTFAHDEQTEVIFQNHLSRRIHLFSIDNRGRLVPLGIVEPGATREQATAFFNSFIATDDSGKFRRLYFAQGRPMTATFADTPEAPGTGYWPSIGKDAFPSQIVKGPAVIDYRSPTGIDSSYIAFINLTRGPLNVYMVSNSGAANFTHTIPAGDWTDSITTPTTFWLVTDHNRNVVGRYATPPISRVAVIR